MKPNEIIAIYDNKETIDRYTIVLDTGEYFINSRFNDCLCLSQNPDWSQGFSQFSSCKIGDHLGDQLDWDELPENIQKHIIMRLK